MDKTQVIIIAAAIAILAFRLYQKYVKKDKSKSGTERKTTSVSSFPSSSKDEEYEPYSKK
jgi:hypothetical protein